MSFRRLASRLSTPKMCVDKLRISARTFASDLYKVRTWFHKSKSSSPNDTDASSNRNLEMPPGNSLRATAKDMTRSRPRVKRSNIYSTTYPISPQIAKQLESKKLSRSVRTTDGLYILHNQITDYIVNFIGPDILREDMLVVEINPGPGVLTQALLDAGVKRLRLVECKKTFLPHLQSLVDNNSNRLSLVEGNFLNLSKLTYIDKISLSSNVEDLFAGAQSKDWTDAPPILVLGVASARREPVFLRYLPMALSELNSLFSYGRTQLMIFVSAKEYTNITATTATGLMKYRGFSVLCQLFFDIELLCKESRCNFFPPSQKVAVKSYDVEDGNLYLLRLTPKKDLLSQFSSPKQLRELAFFVRQNMVNRNKYIISTLENWIPKSGPRLIRNGFTIFKRFGDLSATELLQLFHEFSSWPEYPECQFIEAMLRTLGEYEEYDE